MAPDHPWIDEHPDYFVHGSERFGARRELLPSANQKRPAGPAYGRDPYFEGWPDHATLNYGNPQLQQAMIGELERIAGQCDGVRCDMHAGPAGSVRRTWGIASRPFWPEPRNACAKNFRTSVLAEVYWDME
jgi:hypothetical protein